MKTLGNDSYSNSVSDQVLVAAHTTRARSIYVVRLTVTAAIRVTVNVGGIALVDQDFPTGGLSEVFTVPYRIEPGQTVTVTTVGTGTTRVTILGE